MGLCLEVAKVGYLAKGFALDLPDVGPGLAPAKADPTVGPTITKRKREQNSRLDAHNGLSGWSGRIESKCFERCR
jgi:hypothetical protein